MKKTIGIGITTVYCLVMVWILWVSVSYERSGQYWMYYDLLIPGKLLFLAALAAFILLCVFAKKKKDVKRRGKKGLLLCSLLLFFAECLIVRSIFLYADWDVFFIRDAAEQYLLGGLDHTYQVYFANNPNNVMMYGITALFLSLGKMWGIDGYLLLVAVGIVLNDLAVLLCALCVYELTGSEKKMWIAYGTAVVLFGLSPWMTVPYTDIFSVFCPAATFYLYLRARRKKGNAFGRVLTVTVLPAVLFLLKPTNVFVLLAIAVVELLAEPKKAIKILAGALCFLLIMSITRFALYRQMDYEEDEAAVKPVEHYLLLGSNYKMAGMYNAPDDAYTNSFIGKQAKREADVELAIKRYREMGWHGWIRHLGNKTYLNYSNGVFGWGKEQHFLHDIPPKESALEQFFCNIFYVGGDRLLIEENAFPTGGGWFGIYSTWRQFVWILVQLSCLFTGLAYLWRRIRGTFYSRGFEVAAVTLTGVFVFLSVFETNARYLYSFLPLYAVVAVLGLSFLTGDRR